MPDLTNSDYERLTDSVQVIVASRIAEPGLALTDSGTTLDMDFLESDGMALSESMTRVEPPTTVPASAAGSLSLAGTAMGGFVAATVTVVATVLPMWRAVRISVGGFGGAPVAVWRIEPGRQPVQARLSVQVSTASSYVGVDYEAPMDVPLVYRAVVTGANYEALPVTIDSLGLDWWTALGNPSISRVVTVESFPELSRALSHSAVRPLFSAYPLVITHARVAATGTLTLLTLTDSEAAAMRTLIQTSPLFQLKSPAVNGLPDGALYLLAGDYVEQRTTRLATEPSRRFIINVIEVDRPPLEVPPPAENTWQDWLDEPLGNSSWGAWLGKSWLDLLVEESVGS